MGSASLRGYNVPCLDTIEVPIDRGSARQGELPTFVSSERMSRIDVKQSCVRPFLALRMRRRMSNPWFEHLRQSDSPHLGDAADNQIAASVVGPRGERQIASALRAHRGVRRAVT